MKAIKITQELKDLNPNLFTGNVGDIYYSGVPQVFKIKVPEGFKSFTMYDTREAKQTEHGWKTIIEPVLGENEVYDGVVEDGENFIYAVRTLSAEEIEARDEIVMPKNEFKIQLNRQYSIKDSNVDALFDYLIANNLATEDVVYEMNILWYQSSVFKSTTPELYQFTATISAVDPNISITSAQLKKIFTDYAAGI